MSIQAPPARLLVAALCFAGVAALGCAAAERPSSDDDQSEGGSGGEPHGGGGSSSGGKGGSVSSSGGKGGSVAANGGSDSGGSGGTGSGGSSTGGSGQEPDAAEADMAGGSGGSDPGTGGIGAGGSGAGGAFPPGPHKVYLLVGDTHLTDPSRLQMIEILESMKDSHGITVQVMDSRMAKASLFTDAALVIAGPNNNYCSDNPDPSLKTMAIPLMVSRDCKTTMIGLGNILNTQEYITALPVKITITNGDHPLAAGLKGEIGVLQTRCRLVRGAKLGPGAIKIAKAPADAVPADADSWPIFAYEKGGEMVGGFKAPAKRMGFFWHRPSAVTPEGKKLFQAAVDWMMRP